MPQDFLSKVYKDATGLDLKGGQTSSTNNQQSQRDPAIDAIRAKVTRADRDVANIEKSRKNSRIFNAVESVGDFLPFFESTTERIKANRDQVAADAETDIQDIIQSREQISRSGGYGKGGYGAAVQRGFGNLQATRGALGIATGYGDEEDIGNIIEGRNRSKTAGARNQSEQEAYERFQAADGFVASAREIFTDFDLLTNIAVESLPSSLPSMVGGAVAGVVGGVVTRSGEGAQRAAGVGTGLGSFVTEYGNTMLETFEKNGVDLDDPEALKAAMTDKELMSEARQRATRRGIAVGAFDGMSVILGGRMGGAPVAKKIIGDTAKAGVGRKATGLLAAGAVETVGQGAFGAAGEAAGQLAADGEITSPQDIVAEFAGEIPSGVVESIGGTAVQLGKGGNANDGDISNENLDSALRNNIQGAPTQAAPLALPSPERFDLDSADDTTPLRVKGLNLTPRKVLESAQQNASDPRIANILEQPIDSNTKATQIARIYNGEDAQRAEGLIVPKITPLVGGKNSVSTTRAAIETELSQYGEEVIAESPVLSGLSKVVAKNETGQYVMGGKQAVDTTRSALSSFTPVTPNGQTFTARPFRTSQETADGGREIVEDGSVVMTQGQLPDEMARIRGAEEALIDLAPRRQERFDQATGDGSQREDLRAGAPDIETQFFLNPAVYGDDLGGIAATIVGAEGGKVRIQYESPTEQNGNGDPVIISEDVEPTAMFDRVVRGTARMTQELAGDVRKPKRGTGTDLNPRNSVDRTSTRAIVPTQDAGLPATISPTRMTGFEANTDQLPVETQNAQANPQQEPQPNVEGIVQAGAAQQQTAQLPAPAQAQLPAPAQRALPAPKAEPVQPPANEEATVEDEEVDVDNDPRMVDHNQRFDDAVESIQDTENATDVRKLAKKMIRQGLIDEDAYVDIDERMKDVPSAERWDEGMSALEDAVEQQRDTLASDIEDEIYSEADERAAERGSSTRDNNTNFSSRNNKDVVRDADSPKGPRQVVLRAKEGATNTDEDAKTSEPAGEQDTIASTMSAEEAQKTIDEALEQLRNRGQLGEEAAAEIQSLLDQKALSADEAIAAFRMADVATKIVRSKLNVKIQFVPDLRNKSGEKVQGSFQSLPLGGDGFAGVLKLSLAKEWSSIFSETAAHETFHVLQKVLQRADPKTFKLLNASFKDDMTLNDIHPSLQRMFKNTRHPRFDASVWDVMQSDGVFNNPDGTQRQWSGYGAEPDTITELQAYVFGYMNDAIRYGASRKGLAAQFSNAYGVFTDFLEAVNNAVKGLGFTSTSKLWRDAASGKLSERAGDVDISTDAGSDTQFSARQTADTENIGKNVNARSLATLQRRIPITSRVANKWQAGTPFVTVKGGKFSNLNLEKAGAGINLNQAELNEIWEAAIAATDTDDDGAIGSLTRDLVKTLGMSPNTPEFWDTALKLQDRARYWYEVSAEAFRDLLPDLTDAELKTFIAIVAATSPVANPYQNMHRAVASMSNFLRGVPIDNDVVIPTTVREAIETGGLLEGLKTGSFGGTMQFVLGLNDTPPLSTNDRQVASTFNTTGDKIAQNPIMYEFLSRFYEGLRDAMNAKLPQGTQPYETWQLQALGWVEERNRASDVNDFDDYLMAITKRSGKNDRTRMGVLEILEKAGIDVKGGKLTRDLLSDPRVSDALSPTSPVIRTRRVITAEINTVRTPLGQEARSLFEQAIAVDDKKAIREYEALYATLLFQASRDKTNPFKVYLEALAGKKVGLTRVSTPTKNRPLDVGGSYNGVVSPNIRVPVSDVISETDMDLMLTSLAKQWDQDAVAAGQFLNAEIGETREGYTTSYQVFIETTKPFSRDDMKEFLAALPEGVNVGYDSFPNGFGINLFPFDADFNLAQPDEAAVATAARSLTKLGRVVIKPVDFKSGGYGEIQNYTSRKKAWEKRLVDGVARVLYGKMSFQKGIENGRKLTETEIRSVVSGEAEETLRGVSAGDRKRLEAYRGRVEQRRGLFTEAERVARGLVTDPKYGRDAKLKSFVAANKLRIEKKAAQKPETSDPVQYSARRASPEFDAWFGDSKIVDDNGEPLVVYHGTNQDIDAFSETVESKNNRGNIKGFFFSTSKSMAGGYGPNTVSAYLKMEKPFVVGETNIPQEMLDEYRVQLIKTNRQLDAQSDANWFDRKVEALRSDKKVSTTALNGNGAAHQATVKAGGFDGIIDGHEHAVFAPTQIKSAEDNNGNFNPQDPRIKYSARRSVPTGVPVSNNQRRNAPKFASGPSRIGPDTRSARRAYWEAKYEKYVNRALPIKQLVKQINDEFNDSTNFARVELLMGSRLATQTRDFHNEEVTPLLREASARGLTLEEVEKYLHAKHAIERNPVIAERNELFPDGGAGISTADARSYLASLSDAKTNALEAVGQKVGTLTDKTLQLMVESGSESQEAITALRERYKNWVPLFREGIDGGNPIGGGTRGASVEGSSLKYALGSNKPVVNIIANIITQREAALNRAENNRLSGSVRRSALEYPDPAFWMVIDPSKVTLEGLRQQLVNMGMDPDFADDIYKAPRKAAYNKKTGMVESVVDNQFKRQPNVVATRVEGTDQYTIFNPNDEMAMRVASMLRNDDLPVVEGISGATIELIGPFTRIWSQMRTQYMPEFGPVNFVRDLENVLINLADTPLKGEQGSVFKSAIKFGNFFARKNNLLRVISNVDDGSNANPADRELSDLFARFEKAGGRTSIRNTFFQTNDPKKIEKQMQAAMKQVASGKTSAPKAVVEAVVAWNDMLENATRLAVFKTAIDNGLTDAQAADLAKTTTVNFQQKGTETKQLNAYWGFFNASVAGTDRNMRVMLSAAGKKIALWGVGLGILQGLMLQMAGYEEDEPPEWVKDNAFTIPIPYTDKFFPIPMLHFYRVFPNIGRRMVEVAAGDLSVGGFLGGSLKAVITAVNPIAYGASFVEFVSPSILDMGVQYWQNQDGLGRRIYNDNFSELSPTTGMSRARGDTTVMYAMYSKIAEGINAISGGDDYVAGRYSPTPEEIKFFTEQAAPPLQFVYRVFGVTEKGLSGEDVEANELPFLRRFYGEKGGRTAEGARFYENVKQINIIKTEIKERKEAGQDLTPIFEEEPLASLADGVGKYYRNVSDLRRERRMLILQGASAAEIKAKNDEITTLMKQFNDLVKETEGQE